MTTTRRTAYELRQAFAELDIPEFDEALEGYEDNVELECGAAIDEDGELFFFLGKP